MEWLSWVLAIGLLAYMITYGLKIYKIISKYNQASKRGILLNVNGYVVGEKYVTSKKVFGENIQLSYPTYECHIDEDKKQLDSIVQYKDVKIGSEVGLLYDKETGELWNEVDIKLIKEKTVLRMIVLIALIIVMMVISILS